MPFLASLLKCSSRCPMAINIAFQNPQSGDIRFVKVGWSWVLFFFSGILGIPLFQWRLYAWGSVFAAMSFISLACNISGTNAGAQFIVLIVVLLQVWIGDLLG